MKERNQPHRHQSIILAHLETDLNRFAVRADVCPSTNDKVITLEIAHVAVDFYNEKDFRTFVGLLLKSRREEKPFRYEQDLETVYLEIEKCESCPDFHVFLGGVIGVRLDLSVEDMADLTDVVSIALNHLKMKETRKIIR